MNELFEDLPQSSPSRLIAARKSVEKAEAECERLRTAWPEYDRAPTPIKWEINEAGKVLECARHELQEAELEELKNR